MHFKQMQEPHSNQITLCIFNYFNGFIEASYIQAITDYEITS